MIEQLANSVYNPTAQLSADIDSDDLAFTVSDVDEFIDTNGDPLTGAFRVLLWDGSTDGSKEVVKVGAFDSGTGVCSSLTRAAEGKNPAMSHDAGDLVELVITAGGLEDYLGGVQTATVTVSSGELLALADTPKELIATPGVGHGIVPISILGLYHFGTTPYVTADAEVINWGSDHSDNVFPTGTPFLSAAQSVSGVWYSNSITFSGKATQSVVENAALVLNVSSGASNPTGGDGTLDFVITYYIRTFP